jgi:hypothetical protein
MNHNHHNLSSKKDAQMKKLHARASQIFNKIFFIQLTLRQTQFVLFLLIAVLAYVDIKYNNYYAFDSLVAMLTVSAK